MPVLADCIAVSGRFARSANLERDAGHAEPLAGYVVTARALDVVERIAGSAAERPSGGAWSLTGPYGSGKSSLALLLDAAFSPPGETRDNAWQLIDDASPAAGELVRKAHERHGTGETGFHRALVTANREPITRTVLRALHAAVQRTHGRIPPASRFRAAGTLRNALADAAARDPRRTGPSPPAVVDVARCLAAEAPLLLIIDEFGKNLEAIAERSDADPYLLQQLAEAGQGSGLPIFMLTLQHLSLEDHLSVSESPRRREWIKVSGRFEDIAYVESAVATRTLIGETFRVEDHTLRGRIARWAKPRAEAMRTLGASDLADSDTVASCYPLHPLVATVLPELCSRYGQHERTLLSFLTGAYRASAASFLVNTELPPDGALPSLGLDAAYDYFVSSDGLPTLSNGRSSRWTEIATRLRDVHGLSPEQSRLAKTIALLNLVSTTGTIRASSRVLALAETDVNALAALEKAGVVTYRDFADEYRIWQGTDIDIRRLLDGARQRTQRRSLVEILSDVHRPAPVVAARHSAEHDVLRVFARRYAYGGESVEPLDPFSPYDGEVLLVVGADGSTPTATQSTPVTKPIVVAIPDDVRSLDRAARELAAITTVLQGPAVEADWVARRELGERLAETKTVLENAVNAAFSAGTCRWTLLDSSGGRELRAGRGSAALSEAADIRYSSTPTVRNEMLNRTDLTSQGAKARRLLLEAMIEHGSEPDLGFDGYGPEVAMYRAFLQRTGLHGCDDRDGAMAFRRPSDSSLLPAWNAVASEFGRAKTRRVNLTDLHAALLSPPVGMKAGVVPVFVTAALLAFNDEVAIYEHGTFQPLLTPELSERMVRNPGHFEIKHFANTKGARRQVVETLAARLGVRPGSRRHRVSNVLSIVSHLVSQVRHLDKYTLKTRHLGASTLSARDALLGAVEPDDLLFRCLPAAFEFRPVPAHTMTYGKADAYANHVSAALNDLRGCHDRLLDTLLKLLIEASGENNRRMIMKRAAAIESDVLNPDARALVLTLANDGVDTDTDWIQAVATVVLRKAPSECSDDDLARFRRELPQQMAAFQRLADFHATRPVNGTDPSRLLQVAFTRQDGSEHVRRLELDDRQRQQADEVFDRTLRELAPLVGSTQRAHAALLALIGERLLAEPATPTRRTFADRKEEGVTNG